MNLSFLIVLLSVLCILPNVGESKRTNKKKKPSQQKLKLPDYPTKPSKVMYYVSNELGPKITETIDELLELLTMETCLYFEKQRSKVTEIGINFFKNSHNKVELSTSKYKPTKVQLKKSIAENKRDFIFFIGLALGLVSEITRNDSKRYVEVLSKNIDRSKLKYYQVKKYESKVLGNTSFDFYSKMLPSPTFGIKKGKKTYKLKSDLSEYYGNSIDLPESFSFNDIKRLWYYYCNKCEKKPNSCQHDGYYRDGNCDKCKCPLPFTGDKCEKIFYNEGCGDTQEFEASSQIKNYTIENIYRNCYYSIKSKSGKKVEFHILSLTLSRKNDCINGVGLEVKYREDKGADGLLLCDNYTNIRFPQSSEIYLNFAGDGIDKLLFSIKEVQ